MRSSSSSILVKTKINPITSRCATRITKTTRVRSTTRQTLHRDNNEWQQQQQQQQQLKLQHLRQISTLRSSFSTLSSNSLITHPFSCDMKSYNFSSSTKKPSPQKTNNNNKHHTFQNNIDPTIPTTEQTRTAKLEHSKLLQSTARLLSNNTRLTPPLSAAQSLEIKSVLYYWSSRFYSPHVLYSLSFGKSKEERLNIYRQGCDFVLELLDKIKSEVKEEEAEEEWMEEYIKKEERLKMLVLGCLWPCALNTSIMNTSSYADNNESSKSNNNGGGGGGGGFKTLGAVVQRSVDIPTYVSSLLSSRKALVQLYNSFEEKEERNELCTIAEVEYLGKKVQLILALQEHLYGVDKVPKELLLPPHLDYLPHSIEKDNNKEEEEEEVSAEEACLNQMQKLLNASTTIATTTSSSSSSRNISQSTRGEVITPPKLLTAYNTFLNTCTILRKLQTAQECLRKMEQAEDAFLSGTSSTNQEKKEKTTTVVPFPDVNSYNAVMHGYASFFNNNNTAAFTNNNNTVGSMSRIAPVPPSPSSTSTTNNNNNTTSSPSSSNYIQDVTKTQELLSKLEKRYQKTKREDVKPDAVSYGIVLHSLASVSFAEEAEEILERMERAGEEEDEGEDGGSFVRPNTVCYNTVIGAYARSRKPNAPQKAESLLRQMQRLQNTQTNPSVHPDTVSYGSVISAWARSGNNNNNINSAKKAEAWLKYTMDLYKKTGDASVKPDSVSFNAVIDAWAKQSGGKKYQEGGTFEVSPAKKAEELLLQMQQLRDAGDPTIRPCTITYNTVLAAIAKSNEDDDHDRDGKKPGQRAETLLRKMQQLYKEGNADIKPDTITYNTVLDAWVKKKSFDTFSSLNVSERREALKAAQRLIHEMEDLYEKEGDAGGVKPDVISYNILMDAIGKSEEDGSAERAEDILRFMEEKYKEGNHDHLRPNNISFNVCINAYAKSGERNAASRAEAILFRMIELSSRVKEKGGEEGEDVASSIQPCTISFTSVIDALSKSGECDAAERAESLLHEMQTSNHAMPNTVTFNTVINAWSQSGERGAAERAEAVLREMEEMRQAGNAYVAPDTVTFSSVINAWARSGEDGAAERAEAILRQMKNNKAAVQPNTITYSAVINAWAKSGKPDASERALAVLHWMEDLYKSGDRDAKPNTFCFNAVINALAKSDKADKAERCYDILLHMKNAYQNGNRTAKPSVMTYSSILNACAYTQGTQEEKSRAFQIARKCFKEMIASKYDKPSNVSFAMFLKAIGRLTPRSDARDLLASSVFRECCNLGQVDDNVLKSYRWTASPHVFQDSLNLMTDTRQQFSVRDLPAEWSSNVQKRRGNNQRNQHSRR